MSAPGAPERPLTVLQVCDHLGWEGSRMHGVKRLFGWMLPRFDPARVRASLVSLRKRDLSEETLEAQGIDIEYLHRSRFDPATLTDLLKIVDRRTVDVLHLHGYGATTFGRLAGAMRGIPTIVHEHANLTDTPWFQKVADRLLEPYTDIALAVSASTATFLREARLVRPERIRVVYLGAPLDEFGTAPDPARVAATRASLGLQPGQLAVGTVTRLHESKGNEYLVDAAAEVVQTHPHARFFLAGEGPLRPALEARAAGLGLGERFVFLGFVKDVASLVPAFDIAVFPSLWEGTPLTLFETMAMGRPIVATTADGLREVLEADVTARLVPPRDASALAREIRRLLDDPFDRDRLGRAARVASADYDLTSFVRKMERLYAILHAVSRPTKRRGVVEQDLRFLERGAPA